MIENSDLNISKNLDSVISILSNLKNNGMWLSKFSNICDNVGIVDSTFDFMIKINNNRRITDMVFNPKFNCKRYITFDDATKNAKKCTIVTYVNEIGVYCLFDNIDDFNIFMSNISEYTRNNGPIITTYQVVFADQVQKITFYMIGGNDEEIENIKFKCENHFNTQVAINKDKEEHIITINKEVNGISGIQNEVDKLKDNILAHDNMKINLGKIIESNPNYIMHNIDHIGEWNGVYDNNMLKYNVTNNNTPLFVIVNNINTINNNVTNNITNNVNSSVNNNNNNNSTKIVYMSVTERKHDMASKWVALNLPVDGISTVEYYNKYKTETDKEIGYIGLNGISKIVRRYSYKNKKDTDKIHKWKKNTKESVTNNKKTKSKTKS